MERDDRRTLREINRAVSDTDWTLNRLLGLAEVGIGVGLMLLVDGVWVQGDPVPPEQWADKLDADLESGIGAAIAGGGNLENLEILREQLRQHSFRSWIDERREEEDHVREQIEALNEGEDVPDDLADEQSRVLDPMPAITLRNVVVGQGPMAMHLPTLRVLRSHIGAWMPGRWTEYNERG